MIAFKCWAAPAGGSQVSSSFVSVSFVDSHGDVLCRFYCFLKSICDFLRWVPGLRCVKCEKNVIGVSFSFWELTGDKLQCFNEVKVREGDIKVR